MERELLARLQADPNDENLRVYADWLEESGQVDRAAYLRAVVAVRKANEGFPRLEQEWLDSVTQKIDSRGILLVFTALSAEHWVDGVDFLFFPCSSLDDELRAALSALPAQIDGGDGENEHSDGELNTLFVLNAAFGLFDRDMGELVGEEGEQWERLQSTRERIPRRPAPLQPHGLGYLQFSEIVSTSSYFRVL